MPSSIAVAQALAVTAEVCGSEMSEAAAKIMLADLADYPDAMVLAALQRVRREHKGRLVLAAIIERIDDGRPGVEVAWAMVPRSEADTAVVTTEMLAALQTAQPLLDEGDEIAARMAFKEAYKALVERSRAAGEPVQWQASVGWDQRGRTAPLADAVRLGRLPLVQAEQYVQDDNLIDLLSLAGVTNHPALAAPKSALPALVAEIAAARTLPAIEPTLQPVPETEEQRITRIDAERNRVKRMLEARGITDQDMQAARRAIMKGAGDAA